MRYALTITGKVQNAGYRAIIEDNANARHLKGYVFNASDGSVKLLCTGEREKIDDFIDAISFHEEDIFVEDIQIDTGVDTISPIPDSFCRIKTDTKEDTDRKLDKGIDAIKKVGADVICVNCPACFQQFDTNQRNISKKFKTEYNIPVLNFFEIFLWFVSNCH